MEVEEIFASIMKEECLEVKELQGGVTNQSFLVQTMSGKYILRVPGKGTNEYINRGYEIENMRRISVLGFIPQIVYSDTVSGIIISEYIDENQPMQIKDLYNSARLKLINEKLIQLHHSDISMLNEFDLIAQQKQYMAVLFEMKIQLPEELKNQTAKLENIVEYLFTKYPKELVPCHGDPKLNNFLLQRDKMWLIDWEYSGMTDKYFDLVNLSMTNKLSTKEEMMFLKSYEYCSNEKINAEKYILYKIATDYLWIYWHLIKLFQGEMMDYNEESWRNRLNRALSNIKVLEELK